MAFILTVYMAVLATFIWESEAIVVVWFWLLCLPMWGVVRIAYREWREE